MKLNWTSWPLKMGSIRCPETSVKDYHSTLRNIAEERRSQPQYDSYVCHWKGHEFVHMKDTQWNPFSGKLQWNKEIKVKTRKILEATNVWNTQKQYFATHWSCCNVSYYREVTIFRMNREGGEEHGYTRRLRCGTAGVWDMVLSLERGCLTYVTIYVDKPFKQSCNTDLLNRLKCLCGGVIWTKFIKRNQHSLHLWFPRILNTFWWNFIMWIYNKRYSSNLIHIGPIQHLYYMKINYKLSVGAKTLIMKYEFPSYTTFIHYIYIFFWNGE
jgi:hypothetical protein